MELLQCCLSRGASFRTGGLCPGVEMVLLCDAFSVDSARFFQAPELADTSSSRRFF